MPFSFVKQKLQQKVDSVAETKVKDVLKQAGASVKLMTQDPYAPSFYNSCMAFIHYQVWEEIQDELEESILASITYGDKEEQEHNKYRMAGWPLTSPSFWKGPYKWFRAKLLYALLPADSTLFKGLRDPVGLTVFILNLWNPYQASVWLFIVLFILIDKRDEYQLVNFILTFKGFQAVSALIGAYAASLALYKCALEVGGPADSVILKNASFGKAAVYETPELCASTAPGTDEAFYWLVFAEPVRLLVVWLAFGMLASGYATGGKEELLALEQVRLDAADGSLDDGVDHKKLKKDPSFVDDSFIPDAEIDAAVAAARKKLGAKTRTGGVLKYFLIYDLCAALYCVFSFSSIIFDNDFMPEGIHGPKSWKFWTTLFMMKQQYCLLAFPFLILKLPILGPGLTEAKCTGYDIRGKLCPSLGHSSIVMLYNQRKERKATLRGKNKRA